MKDVGEDLLLCDAEVHVLIVGVRALVDDPVHVQVQIIKLRDLSKERSFNSVLITNDRAGPVSDEDGVKS